MTQDINIMPDLKEQLITNNYTISLLTIIKGEIRFYLSVRSLPLWVILLLRHL